VSLAHDLSALQEVNRLRYLDLEHDFGGVSNVHGVSDKCVQKNSGKTFDEYSERTQNHELQISYFHIAFKRVCNANGLQLHWRQTYHKEKTIHPDALFAITDTTKPENANTNWFLLEIECSTLGKYKDSGPSILPKLAKHHGLFNSEAGGTTLLDAADPDTVSGDRSHREQPAGGLGCPPRQIDRWPDWALSPPVKTGGSHGRIMAEVRGRIDGWWNEVSFTG